MPLDAAAERELIWQCRRGLLELDLLFDRARAALAVAATQEAQQIQQDLTLLLPQADLDLQAWLIQGEEVLDAVLREPVARLRRVLQL